MESIFNDFYFTSAENVTAKNFEKKIAEAMDYLKKINELDNDPFKKVRQSVNQGYTINGAHFVGSYITYVVNKNNRIVANLNCFISDRNDYMEVQTWQ